MSLDLQGCSCGLLSEIFHCVYQVGLLLFFFLQKLNYCFIDYEFRKFIFSTFFIFFLRARIDQRITKWCSNSFLSWLSKWAISVILDFDSLYYWLFQNDCWMGVATWVNAEVFLNLNLAILFWVSQWNWKTAVPSLRKDGLQMVRLF